MAHHHHDNDHGHSDHAAHAEHGHSHGVVDPSIATTTEGLWALKWSFVVLMATALLQAAIVFVSGSVGLLADTIHNFGDAATAIPLGIAFLFARKQPN
ncbi:MAG TPA: cation transporter, partial [Xanthobacteraceae bacterium]|nr:cation transporter [Xanthobacteraceae bacterium]